MFNSHNQQARTNCTGNFAIGPDQSGIGHNYGQGGQYGPIANMYDGFQQSNHNAHMKQYGNESNFLANTDSSGVSSMTNNTGMFNAVEGSAGFSMQSQNYSYANYGMVGQEGSSQQNRPFSMQSSGNNDTFDKAVGYNSATIPGKNVGYPIGPGPVGSRRVSAPAGLAQRNYHQRGSSFTQDITFPGADMNSGFTSDQALNSVTHRNYPSGQYHVMHQSNMYGSSDLPMGTDGNLQQNYQQQKYQSAYPNSSMAMRGQKAVNYGMSRSGVYPSGSSASLTRTTSRPSIQRSFSAGRVDDSYNKMAAGGHLMQSASFELNRGFMNGTEFGNMQMKESTNRVPSLTMSTNLLDSMGQPLANPGSMDQSQMNRLSTQRLRHYGPSPGNQGMDFSNVQGMDSTTGFANTNFNPMQSTSAPLNSNPSTFENTLPNPMQTMNPSGSGAMSMDSMAMVNQTAGAGYMNSAPGYQTSDSYNIPRTHYQSKTEAYGTGLPNMNGTDMMGTYDPNVNPNPMGKMNTSNPMQFQPQAVRRHTRTDRIFSQELEKLAKLSRNPMSEPFSASPIMAPIESGMNPQVNTFPGTAETIPSPNSFPKASISPGFQPEPLPQPSQLPDSESFLQNTQVNRKTTNNLKPIQSLPTTPHYSAPSTPNNQTAAVDVPVSSSPSNNTPTSHTFTTNDSGNSPTEFKESKVETEDRQNAVKHLQRLTHTIKDKQPDSKGLQGDYISHGNTESNVEGGSGSQNCIAALSAACRNMIADMDSTMPKQKTPNQGQPNSTLPSFETLTTNSTPSYTSNPGLTQNNSGMVNTTNMNSFNNNQYGMNSDYLSNQPFGGTNHFIGGVDFQLQYQDFLEQSLPMQMTHKRPDEKPKRTRRRKVSEDMSDQISNTSGQKRRRSRKKSQNPPSVDSIGTPQSIDTCATPVLSDNFLDDITNNGTCTTTMQPMSFGSLNSHTPSPNCTKASPCQDGLSGNFLDSENFESVFSPDTTAQSIPHENDEGTNCALIINPSSSNSSKPSTPNRPSSNYSSASLPIVSPNSGPHLNSQASSLPTSTGIEFNASQVASENVMQSQEATNEAHPLEILQQQIELQRQQFNLGETLTTGKDSTTVKTTMCNTTNHSQTDINVDALITDKSPAWYLTNDSKKDEVLLPWEDSKNAPSTMSTKVDQVDRRTQHKLSEQKRRETIKNSFESLKKVVPDCQNLADQNQQSVLLKAQTFIVDMLDKQHRQKLRADNFDCLKTRNRQLEQNITRIQQEYEILSNMD